MSKTPIIPQPRPCRPASNGSWTIPVFIAELVIIAVILVFMK